MTNSKSSSTPFTLSSRKFKCVTWVTCIDSPAPNGGGPVLGGKRDTETSAHHLILEKRAANRQYGVCNDLGKLGGNIPYPATNGEDTADIGIANIGA